MTFSGLFITATNTDAGKTYIGSHLCRALMQHPALSVVPRKPVESGCKIDSTGHLVASDAEYYYQACERSYHLDDICPLKFEAAVAPPHAATLVGQSLLLDDVIKASGTPEGSFALIEGAGGIYSPIAENALNVDLAKSLKLPTLLVVNDELGCINHTLLTLEALTNASLETFAIVLNRQQEADHCNHLGNYEYLSQLTSRPLIHHLGDINNTTQALISIVEKRLHSS